MLTITNLGTQLATYSCEKDIGILPQIFFDYGLRDYFKVFCDIVGVGDFASFANTSEDFIEQPKLIKFYQNCKLVCLIFEGCTYTKVSYKETKLSLLFGLFYGFNKETEIQKTHDLVKEVKRIDDLDMHHVYWMLSRKTLKNVSDTNAVINDAMGMYVYWCKPTNDNIVSKVTTHNKKMHDLAILISIDYVFTKIQLTNWNTRWGKMKAFNRNWPKLINDLRMETRKICIEE